MSHVLVLGTYVSKMAPPIVIVAIRETDFDWRWEDEQTVRTSPLAEAVHNMLEDGYHLPTKGESEKLNPLEI